MVQRVLKTIAIILVLSSVSCSKSSSSGKTPPPPSLATRCSTNSECTQFNTSLTRSLCDTLFPQTLATNPADLPGTCRTQCTPGAASSPCASNEVCNPITNACEPDCLNSGGDSYCNTHIKDGTHAKCIETSNSKGYCILQGSSATCPPNMKLIDGNCKVICNSTNNPCADTTKVCNVTTSTCEVPCNFLSGDSGLNLCLTQAGTGTACSPITGICSQSCASATAVCADVLKKCYVPSTTTSGSGTCEVPCTNPDNPCPFSAAPSTAGRCTNFGTTAAQVDFCEIKCDINSISASSCPANMACIDITSGLDACKFLRCPTNQCPTNYECLTNQCVFKCVPTSTTDSTCTRPACSTDLTCQQTNPNTHCDNGRCADNTCTSNTQCASGYFCNMAITNGKCQLPVCGNGVIELNELCDEGAATPNSTCDTTHPCPTNWTCSSGACTPNIPGAGNGQNGHCSTRCDTFCAEYVTYSNNPVPGWANSNNHFYSTTINGALQNLGASNTPPTTTPFQCRNNIVGIKYPSTAGAPTTVQIDQCPCGYGIWVSNGTAPTSTNYPDNFLQFNSPMGIYGGFTGTEKSLEDRKSLYLGNVPLGQDAPSATILDGTLNRPVIALGDGSNATQKFILDGFQILNGKAGGIQTCGTTTPTPAAGGLTICKNADVTLKNLRISGNQTQGNGGGIRNLGFIKMLSNSTVSLNTAAQGGGLSHESMDNNTNIIQNVSFFGNRANVSTTASTLPPLNPVCIPGGICPTGYSCPALGGLCIPAPSCGVGNTPACPTGSTCPLNGGLCTPPLCDSGGFCTAGWTCPSNSLPGAQCIRNCTTTATTDCSYGWTCSTSGTCTPPITPTTLLPNYGGAIYAKATSPLNLYAIKFNSNSSYGHGGGIYSHAPLNIVSSLFAGNWASSAGGGIYLFKDSNSPRPANLYNLTFVDNKAYNQGGGGIFDEGTSSKIYNSLFRNNTGLYPVNNNATTNNNFAEWGGNRTTNAFNFPQNQVGAISDGVHFNVLSMGATPGSGTIMTKNSVDTCPVIGYTPKTPAICDGTQICGDAVPVSTQPTNYTLTTTCPVTATEFLNCTAPTYTLCQPKSAQGKQGTNSGQTLYPLDLAGNALPSTPYEGAYNPQP